MAIVANVLTSLVMEFKKRNLTYKAWIPFDYSSPVIYILVYIHQLIGMATSGIVNVACEGVICGLLLHICCQLDILGYRLTKIPQGQDTLRDCISHHNRIFELVSYYLKKIIIMPIYCALIFKIRFKMQKMKLKKADFSSLGEMNKTYSVRFPHINTNQKCS